MTAYAHHNALQCACNQFNPLVYRGFLLVQTLTSTQGYCLVNFCQSERPKQYHIVLLTHVHVGLFGGSLGFVFLSLYYFNDWETGLSVFLFPIQNSSVKCLFIGLFLSSFLFSSLHILDINPINYISYIYDKWSSSRLWFHSWCVLTYKSF